MKIKFSKGTRWQWAIFWSFMSALIIAGAIWVGEIRSSDVLWRALIGWILLWAGYVVCNSAFDLFWPKSEWIPVEKRLPKPIPNCSFSRIVLVTDGKFVRTAFLRVYKVSGIAADRWVLDQDPRNMLLRKTDITHWKEMKLP